LLRWLKTLLAVACWSFLLVGCVGLGEGVSQWLRFDVLGDQVQPYAPLRLFAPYLVLYGWWGVLGGVLVFVPALLVSRWAGRPRRMAFAIAVAGALAFLAVVYAGYLGHAHLWPDWWEPRGGSWVTIILLMVWALFTLGLYRPCRRLADWMARQKTRTLAFPVVVIIVATAHWPDWRQEGHDRRTGHLQRAVVGATARPGAPNLVLITIDTWRRDHLSLINADAPPTPHLDALAQAGTVWTNAWSVSPWTLPSMGTIMTGLPPRVLGSGKYVPLPQDIPTLAEIAWQQGYATTAFATNPYLTEWYGFDRGFEFFEHSLVLETLLPAQRSVLSRELHRYAATRFEANNADHVVERARQWLIWHEVEQPLFLWLHFMNPHLPYRWRQLPEPAADQKPACGIAPDLATVPDNGRFAGRQYKGVMHIRTGEFVPDSRQREALRTLYAREVQYTDHCLGRLFDTLRQQGLWRNTVVTVLSDHGEEFWEHDGFEHGHSVMPEVSGVPWILRLPADRAAGQRVSAPVTTLDVFPTLCGLLNWPLPSARSGQALLTIGQGLLTGAREGQGDENSTGAPPPALDRPWSTARPDRKDFTVTLCIENMLYGPAQQATLLWPWFMVRSAADSGVSWYDLSTDPLALHPQPPPAAAIALIAASDTLLQTWDRQAAALNVSTTDDREEIPADLKRRLEALGY
jgi:arylsulfatase A-like enzyme